MHDWSDEEYVCRDTEEMPGGDKKSDNRGGCDPQRSGGCADVDGVGHGDVGSHGEREREEC